MRKGTSPRGCNGHLPDEGIAVRPARHVPRALAAILTGAVGWTAIETRGPLSASNWMISAASAAVFVAIVALTTAAILGGRDSRSPFERTMLFLCLVLQRPPATYLPPQPPEHPKVARARHQERSAAQGPEFQEFSRTGGSDNELKDIHPAQAGTDPGFT